MFEFDSATQVSRVSGDDSAATYQAKIRDGWDIFGAANGGYVGAVIARAMQLHGERPDPYTLTVHYLAPVTPGVARIEIETVKRGRLTNSMMAKLFVTDDAGKERVAIAAIGAFGNLERRGTSVVKGNPPVLPDFDSIAVDRRGDGPNLMERLALRIHPDDAVFAKDSPNGEGSMRAWFAFPDDRPMDALATIIASDATAPAVFNLVGQVGWVPTIELTIHFRQIPTGNKLKTSFSSRFLVGGLVEEDGEIWDVDGNLIAISRQIAAMPRVDY